MPNGEQKDFLDFIKDVTENQQLAQDFLNVFNKEGATAEGVYNFMKGSGYAGVSLKDCEKMMAVKATTGAVEIDRMTVKY